MKLVQINTTVNTGSTGRIAEEIGNRAIKHGFKSVIAYSRMGKSSTSHLLKIGNRLDTALHGLGTRIFDRHSFYSKNATKRLISQLEAQNPSLIHLHNLHGYYLNIKVLFEYLKMIAKPVVWTLHDCWAFTGHCTYFDSVNCERWKTECHSCPKTRFYPSSLFVDNSSKNYSDKRQLFNGLENLVVVTPSRWLADLVRNSFLNRYETRVINNGVNLDVFKPVTDQIREKFGISSDCKVILGCASTWDSRKGLSDFIKLSSLIPKSHQIVLVGLKESQSRELPSNIVAVPRTENAEQLAALYSTADVFVNPTWQDNFPTTNIEALACGTPVVTYNTGGSPEAINDNTGYVVERGDISSLFQRINRVISEGKNHYQEACRERAVNDFNQNDRFDDYINLYKSLVN